MSPPSGKKAPLIVPIVPGKAKYATQSTGMSAGQYRLVSFGRSQRNTSTSGMIITTLVRVWVERPPRAMRTAATHQKALRLRCAT